MALSPRSSSCAAWIAVELASLLLAMLGAGMIVAGLLWIGLRLLDGSHIPMDWIISGIGCVLLAVGGCVTWHHGRRCRFQEFDEDP